MRKKIATAPRTSTSDTLEILMILDRTSIELFYDNGGTLMTEIFFPKKPYTRLSVKSKGEFVVEDLEINQFNLKKTDAEGEN